MTAASLPRPQFDDDGNLRPLSDTESLAVLTRWANTYPPSRFLVVEMAPDGWNTRPVGWGLARPDHAFVCLPGLGLNGRFADADELLELLNLTMDARLIWLEPPPEPESDDE